MNQRGRPKGTTKPKGYRSPQVTLDELVPPKLTKLKRLEWLVGKLVRMIEQLKGE